ncbi:MAG: GTP 3',8-cyclase MoaA [Chloracidobacterium sp.]|nr:GTP 3',8-cyclase MoaA [Chloracidobacterium sp.]MDW8216852.1 GTP 3',8-cyclase MoaA [Acidobacteriota bacterium]
MTNVHANANYLRPTLRDAYGRVIRDLRISITDRCNFRCTYCMPEQGAAWKSAPELLTADEILTLAQVFVSLGIEKIRLTGGEALLRNDVVTLVRGLGRLPGVVDLALTTNGYRFETYAAALAEAGLRRVTISLDSLRDDTFQRLTRVRALDRALRAIALAQQYKLTPVRVNCVLIRGVNDAEIEAFAEFARAWGVSVRFIEYMPLDGPGAWRRELVVPGREVYARVHARYPLRPVVGQAPSETARRYRFADGAPGEIGIIAPVTEPFCGACSRLRLTADGKLRTCLFSVVEYDLRDALRAGASMSELAERIVAAVARKEAGHRINEPDFTPPGRTMSCIGG